MSILRGGELCEAVSRFIRFSRWEEVLTQKDDSDCDEDHENMVISQKGYQPLNTYREPYVRHCDWDVLPGYR